MSKDFLDQRLSAMILLVMVPVVELYLCKKGKFDHAFMIFLAIGLLIALYHAYLGAKDIMTDYCPNSPYIKRFFFFTSLAVFMGFCVIKIFCGSEILCS